MDLRNNRITIGELLNNPKAKAVLASELPEMSGSPYLILVRGMTLEKVISKWGGHIPPERLQRIVKKLKEI